ncbi:MAG: hypothetical protein WC829_15315 [Hyphomicrobium sp.]|jgi:hypothetical protein
MNWNHKDEWSVRSTDFMVQVTRHSVQPIEGMEGDEGENRWCVYAYIYPKHPKFSEFTKEAIYQPATENIPLHGGCSFCRIHVNSAGERTSVQVGADYNHLHDDEFTFFATQKEAWEVFHDGDKLFNYLDKFGKVKEVEATTDWSAA